MKIEIREIFSCFWKNCVEQLVAYMAAVYGSYLFACSKTSNIQLSQNSPVQAIWLGWLKHDWSDLLCHAD